MSFKGEFSRRAATSSTATFPLRCESLTAIIRSVTDANGVELISGAVVDAHGMAIDQQVTWRGDNGYMKERTVSFPLRQVGDWDLMLGVATDKPRTAADLLQEMANTFRERNVVYGDNYKVVAAVMMTLFPEGIALTSADNFLTWHLFELIVVKLTRFTNSGLTHKDSIHDIAVYAAMLERVIEIGAAPIVGPLDLKEGD